MVSAAAARSVLRFDWFAFAAALVAATLRAIAANSGALLAYAHESPQ
jgi:hypothetical protein